MHTYRSKGIKDIIAEFPRIESILEEYGIGCGPCTVGICQLKDIVDIHSLGKDAEEELMLRIEAEIYPQRNIALPKRISLPVAGEVKTASFSTPLQILVDEHKLIKRWLALIPFVTENLDPKREKDRQDLQGGIDLIRSYADSLHHGKEEDILFGYFDDSADIFQVIYEDHRKARALVHQMLASLAGNHSRELMAVLLEYAGLLQEHIDKEDGVLFPWLDQRLTDEEKEELLARFAQADGKLSLDIQKYHDFIEKLEKRAG